MAKLPRRPDALAHKIFRGSRAIGRGLLTRAELRSSAWRPLFRDAYADARLAVTHGRRCRAASRLLIPEGAAIAGRSAAHLFGVPYVDTDAPVEVLTPRDFGPGSRADHPARPAGPGRHRPLRPGAGHVAAAHVLGHDSMA